VKTEDLINALARGEDRLKRRDPRMRMAIVLLAGLTLAAGLLFAFVGARPDIGAAIAPVLAKAGFSALAAAVMLPLAARLMRPGRPLGWRVAAVFVFVALCALAAIIALIGAAPEQRLHALMGNGFPWCLVLVPVLASPTAALLVWLARAFAPTRLTLSGAAIGGLSGGVGAMAYAMYCPVDSVAFVTTWYVLAIALCAAVGALLGSRILRW
jgi:hypothetical protein